ncbi:MAG TPA: hypothetical protein VMB34_10665 [Acetobacteraceae bacterium]|nr:hypothetical protein [Acetobacteraceae bacterium]
MRLRFLLLCFGLLPFMAARAADGPRHKVVCPAGAPVEWQTRGGALSGVEVLAAPRGSKIDETAPPSLVPDEQIRHGANLQQIWHMNAEGPGWAYYVDCHYHGAARVLRLDASGTKRCERRLLADQPDGPQSLACD